MTPEQIEQAARIVCAKREQDPDEFIFDNEQVSKGRRWEVIADELTTFMQLAEACDKVLTEEVPA